MNEKQEQWVKTVQEKHLRKETEKFWKRKKKSKEMKSWFFSLLAKGMK